MRTVSRTAVLLCAGIAVLFGMAGGATAQDDTENRLRALEERLQQQDQEIERLRGELAGQQEVTESLEAEMDGYLGKVEDASWWQEPNTFRVYWDKGLVFQTADKNFKLKIGGRAQYEHYWADYDDDLEDYLGTGGSDNYQTEFRRVRFYMSGDIYGNAFYKVQLDFAGSDYSFKDVYLGIKGLPVIGRIQLGNFKEPFSLEELTSSKYITFMERGLPNIFVPGRNAGIALSNSVLDNRLFWAIGAFNNGTAQKPITQGNAITARVAGLPYYENKGEQLIHLGLAYSYRHRAATRTGEFAQRPEAHLGKKLLKLSPSVSSSNVESQNLYGFEVAAVFGPLSFQAEYIMQSLESDSLDDPTQSGFYVFVSYFVTGERRPYKGGKFDRVKPLANFDGEGGTGAIELVVRYSMLDYEDGVYYDSVSKGMPDGQLSDLTFGVNWYLNPNMRIMVNYVMADLEGVDGVNIFQIRWQIDF